MIQWIKLALPIYFTIHFSKMLGYQKKIKFILKRDRYIMKKKNQIKDPLKIIIIFLFWIKIVFYFDFKFFEWDPFIK